MGAAALGAALVMVGLELTLRLAPAGGGVLFRRVDAANPVLRGAPGSVWVHSLGWSFFNPHRGRLNNEGFNDPQDYVRGAPVIAVLGDSYVEATTVAYADSLQARLRGALAPCPRVYSFGRSGANPADYVAYLRWAQRRYDVAGAVVLISAGDLEEAATPREGGNYYVRADDGAHRIAVMNYAGPGPLHHAVNASSLARYLLNNLQFNPITASHALGRTSAPSRPVHADRDWIVPAFLADLRASLPPERVTLVFDADRRAIADGAAPAYPPERARMIADARLSGFTVVDLDPAFRNQRARDARKVDYAPLDGHWNALGHQVAAAAVVDAWRAAGSWRHAAACPGPQFASPSDATHAPSGPR
ncbi:hypothetical protein [Caulobacter sp. 17J65-9]|uniref:hypothetical protein n=1 Tax=Caulobacter sp. 17J65-9 TaxID=2709382 RepID=UPI0013C82496|nr:hypothetical protein [Caulobacter sp. 17J65-9]NEX93997.1 hypothetical protein [Caulobacter sp. 17J65-9]